jgi:hypothetical protein
VNVILNTEEVHAVTALVTAQVLDHVELSTEAKKLIRAWRKDRELETFGLDELAEVVNTAIGNHIDERTTRMMRRSGKVKLSTAAKRV